MKRALAAALLLASALLLAPYARAQTSNDTGIAQGVVPCSIDSPCGASGGGGGASGPSGPRGLSGPSGPQGPSGVSGPSGPAGTTGAAGATGAAGPSGVSGPSGPSGPAGATGAGGSAPFSDATAIVKNASDATKTVTIDASGVTTANNVTVSASGTSSAPGFTIAGTGYFSVATGGSGYNKPSFAIQVGGGYSGSPGLCYQGAIGLCQGYADGHGSFMVAQFRALMPNTMAMCFAIGADPVNSGANTCSSSNAAGVFSVGTTATVGDGTGTIRAQHHIGAGTAPGISSCGTSPSISGSDAAGKATIGTAPGTSCVITFNVAYTNAPACFSNDETTSILSRAVTTTTTLTLNGVFVGGDVVSYGCIGF